MSSLHNVFYKSLPIIKDDIFGSLVSRGFISIGRTRYAPSTSAPAC